MWQNTLLLDGKTKVASDQLVSSMIKAALLAHEQSGSIRLEFDVNASGRKSKSLMVVPTGPVKEWPPATLEARLSVNRRAQVSDVIFDWLGEESNDPWDRAAEQGKIMLVLRGIADVCLSKWGTRKYSLARDATSLPSETSMQPALDLLTDCRKNRPEIWHGMDQEIQKAVERRKRSNKQEYRSSSVQSDPWLAERLTDQKKYSVHPKAKVLSTLVTLPIGIGLAVLDWWFATRNGFGVFALVTAGILSVVFGVFLLPLQSVRDREKRISAWVAGRMRVPFDVPDTSKLTWKDRLAGFVIGVAAITGVALICVADVKVGLFLLGGGWGAYHLYPVLYKLLANKAAAAINRRVTGNDTFVEPPISPDSTLTKVSLAAKIPRVPIVLEFVTAEAFPPVSDESRRRLNAIALRGPSIRSVYRKEIRYLAGSTALLAILYWLTGPSPFNFTDTSNPQSWEFPGRMPTFFIVAFLITLVMLSRRGSAWLRGAIVSTVLSVITGAQASLDGRVDIDEATASIRPIGLPVLGAIWVITVLIVTPTRYASLKSPLGLLFTASSLAVAFRYLYWIWRTAKALEGQYPYQPPFNLLALRVFGSPHLSDFLDLTNSWQWIGTRQMLDGPDTVGQKARDLINYFSGRLDNSIVENTGELHEALRDFKAKPDKELRFPVNSMQCSDASWKEALQSLLDAADVVVMDLSNLSEKNRGIAYELGKIFDQIAVKRIVLLADDSTNLDLLKDILAQAWENMAAGSPNREIAENVLRVYHVGGPLKHLPGESLYDWKRRLRTQIDEKHLVCLLYDAAQPRRTSATVDSKRDLQSIRWSRIPMPSWFRSLRNFAFAILLFVVLLTSSCKVLSGG